MPRLVASEMGRAIDSWGAGLAEDDWQVLVTRTAPTPEVVAWLLTEGVEETSAEEMG